MPLATDPTVIYAALLENRYRGAIYASDLKSPSAYNTYLHPGLPPGPICNPGLASLRAAIAPAKTDYLYFVSDDNGHSRFSASLKEHTLQVQPVPPGRARRRPPLTAIAGAPAATEAKPPKIFAHREPSSSRLK